VFYLCTKINFCAKYKHALNTLDFNVIYKRLKWLFLLCNKALGKLFLEAKKTRKKFRLIPKKDKNGP